MASAFALGLLIGFPIAASPGPMFFLVLRRTLGRGWRSGLASGLGIASGDGICAAIAAFGVVAVINLLVAQRRWIGLVGGVALAVIGIWTIVGRDPLSNASNARIALKRGSRGPAGPNPPPQAGEGVSKSLKGEGKTDYLSTLALTLSNPPTILSFLAVFAGLGVRIGSGWQAATALVLGVLLGSALWWVLLTVLVALMRSRISPTVARAIGVGSGVALIGFGLLITLQAL